jgi:hypothetical protein
MDEPFKIKRIDRFQRMLITFFFNKTLSDKERKKVIWTVRLVTVVAALVFAMLITLVTESILSFFWFILVFVAWYVMLKTSGMLKKILWKKHYVQ